jgi:hypothetical protein
MFKKLNLLKILKKILSTNKKSYPQISMNVENFEAIENFEAAKMIAVPFFVFAYPKGNFFLQSES